MINGKPERVDAEESERKSQWIQHGILGAVCMLVIGIYAYTAHSGSFELSSPAADTYYNLLVQGFCNGQLSLKKEVPLEFEHLANPYDLRANAPYQSGSYKMLDMSYYKNRFYLYFGVTPALILFWPFTALTGHYLFQRQAVVIFCALGFLASVGLLHALWRRYFAEVSVGVVAACVLTLGLATGVPVLLPHSNVYEVPISCGYMLTMLALWAIWCALHEPERRCRWLAAASFAYGLAVGARPSLLFGAAILFVPVIQEWRERRPIWALLTAATGPIMLIGLGLMLYNYLRFDGPFEFGWRYQLATDHEATRQYFSLRYLWFNLRVYFLALAHWSGQFPFVHGISVPPLPVGYGRVETPAGGILTNIPLVWAALAVPLAWRNRSSEARSALCWFITAVTLLFGICAMTIGFFFTACVRYEVDFLPALVLLAVVGILGLERALAPTPKSGLACQRVWRRAARCGWTLLLVFSVAFNLLAGAENSADTHCEVGDVLFLAGKVQDAIEHYEQALRIKPDHAKAHAGLGIALTQAGRLPEAIGHFEQALRIRPNFAGAHNNFGVALLRLGRVQEAIRQYDQALLISPNYAEAHYNLGIALAQTGNMQGAIGHFEQALRIKPDDAETHYFLGAVLAKQGRTTDAVAEFSAALRIKPDFAEAQKALAKLRVAK